MLAKLIQQRTQLLLQRAQAKDVVEASERQLAVVVGQIAVLEADQKERNTAVVPLTKN